MTSDVFIKTSTDTGQNLRDEAAALGWLAEAEAQGGLHAAKLYSASCHELQMERVHTAEPTREAAEAIGRALAHTHAQGASWYGAPPAGFSGSGYVINNTLTPIVTKKPTSQRESSWGYYFSRYRIRPFVKELFARGIFDSDTCALFERVCQKLENGDFDAPEPKFVQKRSPAVARVHGDLWAGNLLFDANPANKSKGVLIDPMAHGGHAETDLAMLQLFGYPYLERVLSAYHECSPLAEGWQERVALHQLPPLLHHCLLFGRSYYQEAIAACARYA